MCVKFSTNEKSAEPDGSLDTENVRGLAGKVFFAAQVTLTVRRRKSPTTPIGRGLMKTPRRGLKTSRFRQITIQYQERSRQAKRI